MEMNSPPRCPNTVTIRRNPHRKARATPSTHVPLPTPFSSSLPSSIPQGIPSFPIHDILSIEVPQNPKPDLSTSESPPITENPISENLRVFLRIRPVVADHSSGKYGKNGAQAQASKSRTKNAWPQNPTTKNASRAKTKTKSEICISVNDCHSVTVCPPASLQDVKRKKSEVYQGFSHVFSVDSSQAEVFEKMMNPLVDDFLRGKSGMLATLGPSGSGKTHTVFGSPREPGMVPLALGRIFSINKSSKSQSSRTFYLSMFEIYSEGGKSERLFDLFQDGGDLCMQQSTIKGLKEVIISDAQHAESLIACGMLKRATAMTNSNNQSSRSQCIINIRNAINKIDEADISSNNVVLTIVDLAGAEREKRTGNQGARLLESNFINNTSMVFGLCLRSLLEHQKNPKKPLQKHFQSSLLTRYLRDYLEGKRRMALILTVKPGEEDYLDTSFLLRQASPFMKIKFNNVGELVPSRYTKRHIQTLPRVEQLKRMKFSCPEACQNDGGKGVEDECRHLKEGEVLQNAEVKPQNCSARAARTNNLEVNEGTSLEAMEWAKKERENVIMQNFAKALWNVLKEYKEKLEVAENQIQSLQERLANEMVQRAELESEVKDLKASSHEKEISPNDYSANGSVELEGCQRSDDHELNAGVSYLDLHESECNASEQRSNTTINDCGINIASCLAVENFDEQGYQKSEGFPRRVDYTEDSTNLKDTGKDDIDLNGDATDLEPFESVVSFPKSLTIADDDCHSVDGDQLHNEEDKKRLQLLIMPKEDVELAPGCNVRSVPKFDSCNKPSNEKKPKRRLLPASSILLRESSGMDFEDENLNPKGARGVERKLALDEKNKTQGSISLLRLLRGNLHL